jgi:peroxiredoxin
LRGKLCQLTVERRGLADSVRDQALQSVHVRTRYNGVIRSTFVVDDKGKIEVAQYNIKATGHVAKLRRDLSV